jgi:Zn-dependent peptidase ImmA (M78 family)
MRKGKDRLEAIARTLRQKLKVDDQRQPDMLTVIFKLKQLGFIRNYERVPFSLPDNKLALFDPDSRLLRFAEAEFQAINAGNRQARFTAAHEAFHPVLGHQRLRYRAQRGQLDYLHLPPVESDEFEANYAAAAFLMPLHLLERPPQEMSPSEIADFFWVSPTAARYRKPELERLWRRENGVHRELPESVTRYLKENKP